MRVALAALALVACAGCASGADDRQDLETAVAPQFARLYAHQQSLLDRVPPALQELAAGATCDRGGPGVPDEGGGDDWACTVSWTDVEGTARQVLYELTWASDGCYRADGPPGVVGQQQLRTPRGSQVSNPVYAFDGCVPRAW